MENVEVKPFFLSPNLANTFNKAMYKGNLPLGPQPKAQPIFSGLGLGLESRIRVRGWD